MKASQQKLTSKEKFVIWMIVLGCGLLVASFCVPPPGEIHNSVLLAFGEILTYAGTVFGIKYHYRGARQSDNTNTTAQCDS